MLDSWRGFYNYQGTLYSTMGYAFVAARTRLMGR
jgi:hypothetical protein